VSLPVERAHLLATRAEEHRWLIDGLWAEEAVGIIGGEPKCCKSFLALDMAVSVAAATPCLGRFAVAKRGRVLLFAAEDALHIVRRRLDGICSAAGVDLADLDIQVITAPSIRLDLTSDQDALAQTVATLQPRLLILDPFVRLHRVDENVSGEVAPLLAYLRDLQRRHQVAVALVHHSRKGAGQARAGQALRGSSEFHAWGDSNLYLRRSAEDLTLAIEHRAAPSETGIPLALHLEGEIVRLEALLIQKEQTLPLQRPPTDRVEQALAEATHPYTVAELRQACRIRTATLYQILADLVATGRAVKTNTGYSRPAA
jgi:AAA domain